MKHGISVICWVYNEQDRIRRFIRAHYDYDEIIIIDKSSSDNTFKIASELGVKVVKIPYTEEFQYVFEAALEVATQDWLFFVTASDVIHPDFTRQLYEKIEDDEFNKKYNNIKYPCVHHILGVSGRHTAIDWGYRNWLGKRDVTKGQSVVHNEIFYENPKTYVFKLDDYVAQHHLGYSSVDMAYERSLRYSKEELKKDITYKYCFKKICRTLLVGLIKQKIWLRGWEGFVSLFWVLSYDMMIFFRIHERELGDISVQYEELFEDFVKRDRVFRNPDYAKLSKKLPRQMRDNSP